MHYLETGIACFVAGYLVAIFAGHSIASAVLADLTSLRTELRSAVDKLASKV